MAAHGPDVPTCLRIPYHDEAVSGGGRQPLAVRAPRYAQDQRILMSSHASDLDTTKWVPDLHERVALPTGSQAIPLRAPSHTADKSSGMGLEKMDLRSLLEPFDHTNRPIE